MDRSKPGFPGYHQLLFTQTHAHWVSDAIQPSHPLFSPSPPTFNLSQHQGIFQWVSSLHQVAKVLEFQLQHHSLSGAIMGDPTHDKVMRRRPEMQGCSGYKGPSRLTPASTPPCSLPLLLLSLFVLLRIFALPAKSSPAPLSLNKNLHRTLINKYPGPGMKEMFQVKTLLLALWLVLQMCTNAHDCSQHLNHKQHKEPDHKRP